MSESRETPLLGEREGPILAQPPPSYELETTEYLYRIGLLVGAGVFFHEAMGLPWNRSLFGVLGILVAILIGLTLVFRWRVMGDWRRTTNRVLYVMLVLVLAFPIAAALDPRLGGSVLPEYIEIALGQTLTAIQRIPGAATMLLIAKGAVSFLILLVTLAILVLGSSGGRRGGLIVAGGLLTLVCLFFHPVIETILGFFFLGLFIQAQWEVPVMVPDRVRSQLHPVQFDYLRDLLREGALSTGETRLYLENNPRHFGELLDYQLVEYDPIAREVIPGRRLVSNNATESVERGFSFFRRGTWLVVGILYFLLPDLIPGPIDDIVIMGLCALSGFNIFSLLRGGPARRLR